MVSYYTWILATSTGLLAVYITVKSFFRKRRPGEPPIVPGSLLLGSAAEYSRNAVEFLQKAQLQHGNIFTIRLINQHLTIVMDPHCYDSLSQEKHFDFEPIQKQVNWNVFSFVLTDPKKMRKETKRAVRGQNLLNAMECYSHQLNIACDRVYGSAPRRVQSGLNGDACTAGSTGQPWAVDGLRSFTSDTIFDAIFTTIFGRDDGHQFSSHLAHENFMEFHRYFNYFWLGAPKSLFPPAVRALTNLLVIPTSDHLLARDDLSPFLRTAIDCMIHEKQSENDIKGHNLVFLHVNYNTYRLAFWALVHLVDCPEALAALRSEARSLIDSRRRPSDAESSGSKRHRLDSCGKDADRTSCPETITVSVDDIEALLVLDSVVQETCRMASGAFMVRYVTQDTWYMTSDGREHLIRKGDRIAFYPPALHKDPDMFHNPDVFKYDRFVDAKFFKFGREVKYPVMAFGTLCLGRRYALLQLKFYLLSVLERFELRFPPGQPPAVYDTRYHGNEVLPSVDDVDIWFRPRPDGVQLVFGGK